MQFEQVYMELQPHFESLLALNHAPLLIKLAAASAKLLSCQKLFVEVGFRFFIKKLIRNFNVEIEI